MLKWAILIFIAVWAWPITLVCLAIWAFFLIMRSLYRSGRRKSEAKKVNSVAPQIRSSLRSDRELLLSVIASTIKKHWNVLEDKFEQYTDEDDYGNLSVQDGIKREFRYFSEKVVLPALQDRIDSGETETKSVALILADTLRAIDNMPTNIKFEDSDRVIATRVLSAIDESVISDDLLYTLNRDPVAMENYVREASTIFMQTPSITLSFGEKLRASQSLEVTPFVALIFTLFSVIHNNKGSHIPEAQVVRTFIGNDPYKYEDFIKGLLRSKGYTAKRTRSSGDFGVDVIASKGGKSFSIQCKLYNRPVGTKSVQEIVSGRIFYKTDYAVVVSDNSFTPAAKTLARKSDVILVHHKNLLHKLESLISHDEVEVEKLAGSVNNRMNQKPAPKEGWTKQDADELITVVLPTINSEN